MTEKTTERDGNFYFWLGADGLENMNDAEKFERKIEQRRNQLRKWRDVEVSEDDENTTNVGV